MHVHAERMIRHRLDFPKHRIERDRKQGRSEEYISTGKILNLAQRADDGTDFPLGRM